MRISELSDVTGVPVATVKYYLRAGLLTPGETVNAREFAYEEHHVSRLRLIRGLIHVLGASITQVRDVLSIIDAPGLAPLEAMGKATSALPAVGENGDEPSAAEPHRAIGLLQHLDFRFEPDASTVRQLDAALEVAENAGITLDDEQIAVYGEAARRIARADFARIPWQDVELATTFAVLGTALYEPLLLGLRRLAHHELGLDLESEHAASGGAVPDEG
ncbi:MerR family transcriptional regulator [Isoptericola halotolerans]|uniref:MerR family transcriptional regulator n=1 Tax=Isoptericola halotolerans TaxID=300560 RepID=UPI003890B49C